MIAPGFREIKIITENKGKLVLLWRAITREGKGPLVRDDAKSINLRWDYHPGAFVSLQKSDFSR